MKKKTDNKLGGMKNETAQKVVTAIKSETARFVFGLLFVIFGVYMLLAFSSFFFTGGQRPEHPVSSESRRTARNREPYSELCRSPGRPVGGIPDQRLFRYFGLLHHCIPDCGRNETHQLTISSCGNGLPECFGPDDLAFHRPGICLRRLAGKFLPLPGRTARIQCE